MPGYGRRKEGERSLHYKKQSFLNKRKFEAGKGKACKETDGRPTRYFPPSAFALRISAFPLFPDENWYLADPKEYLMTVKI